LAEQSRSGKDKRAAANTGDLNAVRTLFLQPGCHHPDIPIQFTFRKGSEINPRDKNEVIRF
jgi:hypothetical protein